MFLAIFLWWNCKLLLFALAYWPLTSYVMEALYSSQFSCTRTPNLKSIGSTIQKFVRHLLFRCTLERRILIPTSYMICPPHVIITSPYATPSLHLPQMHHNPPRFSSVSQEVWGGLHHDPPRSMRWAAVFAQSSIN